MSAHDVGRIDATALTAATVKYLDEGNRALRAQLAAFNRLRLAAGLAALRLHEERGAA